MKKWRNRGPIFSSENSIFKELVCFNIAAAVRERLVTESKWLIKRLVNYVKELGLDPEDASELPKNCRGVHNPTCMW